MVLALVAATTMAFAASETVDCGTTVTITANATTGYHFMNWSDGNKENPRDITLNGEDVTLQAIFAIDTFTIRFLVDGEVYDTKYVTYGSTPEAPANPTKASTAEFDYTFENWGEALVAATADKDYNAVFTSTKRSYTVTFKNYDDSELQSTSVEYGETPVYDAASHGTPTHPTVEGVVYTFDGWSETNGGAKLSSLPTVTGTAVYYAHFTTSTATYTVTTAVSGLGGTAEVVGPATVNYNGTVHIKAEADNCYEFDKWLEDNNTEADRNVTVTEDATYTATFKKIKYTITVTSDESMGTVQISF